MVRRFQTPALVLFVLLCCFPPVPAQTPVFPNELRGYKVERAATGTKAAEKKAKDAAGSGEASSESESAATLRFGDPQLAAITPLGISLEVPIIVAPVERKGSVDFLVFEDMVVNGTSVEIDEYHNPFELPNKEALTLREPLKFYIFLPSAVLAAIDEWNNSKETWLVTGRVYVFGRFKKLLFSFKRCVPLELRFTIRNPLRGK